MTELVRGARKEDQRRGMRDERIGSRDEGLGRRYERGGRMGEGRE